MSMPADSLKGRIQQLRDTQLHNARHLDLQLETTPRDSRYSQGLIDAMQRLDMLMREGKAPADLSRKVDDMLKQETRSFFCRVSAANAKRWSQALQRWELDTDAVLHEAKDKVLYNPDTSSARKAKITSRDLDLEELRLEEEYNRNWLRHEGFHLQEAFLSQQRKLSKEWDLYRAQLNDATLAKKKAILGANYASYIETNGLEATLTAASGEDQRFHHPEKQKSLIHTAPVIVPKLDGQGKSSKLAAGSAVRAVRSGKEDAVVQAELKRLDAQLAASFESLEAQKLHATKWMNQQNVRIMVQAEETAPARVPMAAFFVINMKLQRALNDLTPSS